SPLPAASRKRAARRPRARRGQSPAGADAAGDWRAVRRYERALSQVTLLIRIFIILALLPRLDIVFYIVYAIAGIYFLARWMTPRAFRALKMDRQFADHAFLGERVEVTLRLHNQKRLPLPWLQLDESVAPELAGGPAPRFAVSLRGRES